MSGEIIRLTPGTDWKGIDALIEEQEAYYGKSSGRDIRSVLGEDQDALRRLLRSQAYGGGDDHGQPEAGSRGEEGQTPMKDEGRVTSSAMFAARMQQKYATGQARQRTWIGYAKYMLMGELWQQVYLSLVGRHAPIPVKTPVYDDLNKKRALVIACSVYRSGAGSMNELYMGSMATTMLCSELGGSWQIGPFHLALRATEKQLDTALAGTCKHYLKYVLGDDRIRYDAPKSMPKPEQRETEQFKLVWKAICKTYRRHRH